MACPFAFFARTPSTNDDYDDNKNFVGPSRLKLTSQLKSGTWKAHREIEKSAGVRALMGSHHAEFAIQFDRMDHVKFLVMLGCIYLTMEDVLFNSDSALRDIIPLLARSDLLLHDIQAHLDEILFSRDASVSDLEHTADEEAIIYHTKIFAYVNAAQVSLKRSNVIQSASMLTADHIALLTKRQAIAVFLYLKEVSSVQTNTKGHHDEGISFTPLSTPPLEESSLIASSQQSRSSQQPNRLPPSNQLILSHAYVRYMGDLSGGQHIVKRLFKLFAIHDSVADSKHDGFSFYSFTSSGKSNDTLKEMIRVRLDALDVSQSEVKLFVDEASQAFLLNGKLLDSLVDEIDTTSIALEVDRFHHRSSFSSIPPSLQSLLLFSLHLYNSHNLAFIAASVLFIGLASAFFFITAF